MKHVSDFAPVASASVFPAVAVEASSAGADGALGKEVSKVERARMRREFRLAKHASKRKSAELLRAYDDRLAGRISRCCYVAHGEKVELQRVTRADGSVSGAVTGVVTCSSVWSCPVCSERISLQRQRELNDLLAVAREKGHRPVMLTLTARHDARTDLRPFLDDLRLAQKRMRQSKTWRDLELRGTVNAFEVTHGRNGWHPHNHLLMVLRPGDDDACEIVERLRGEWLRQLARLGRDGNEAAFQVQDARAVGEYIAKFGAGEELAFSHRKKGRGGSRTPWQILADARDGCRKSARLWVEYSLAFKGKRQLNWSHGLKAWAGVDQVDDADCEADAVVSRETLRAWPGYCDDWKRARRRLCALLDAAEVGGCLDAAEFGLSDAQRWRAELAASAVLE